MTRYRRELNEALVRLVDKIQPLQDKYHDLTSGPQNQFTMNEAGKIGEKVSQFKRNATEDVIGARDSYLERLEKKIKSFSGGTVDEGDIQIINSPIMVMSPEEYDLMCERYEGNRSMERLLIAYVEKYEDQLYKNSKQVYEKRFMSDKEKKDLAASLCGECMGWINNNQGFGVKDYVMEMAGGMFNQADLLKE